MIRASPEFLRLLERYELAVLANPQSWHWKDAKGTPVVVGRTQAVIPKLSAAEKQRFASFLTWMSTTFKNWDGVTEGTASLLATLEQEGVAAQASPAVAADGQAGGQGGAQKAGGDVQRDQRQGLRAHIYDVLRAVRMTTRQGTLLLRIITASGVLWSHAGRVVRRALRQPAQAGAQERRWEARRAALRREIARLKKEVERERARRTAQKERVRSQAKRRAARAIRERSFRPTRDDLHVYASILLIPAKA